MASSKRMNLISIIAIVLCVVLSLLLPETDAEAPVPMGYEGRLFDVSRVHTIDISMENWDEFLKTCANEEYAACEVTVDGEKFKNVAIRAKGNTSLSSVSQMDSDRYSFKIEFDHFDDAFSYHGLDKLSLNNVIQDNTFMKDYLTYRMMSQFGVPAPLTSFSYITVNGEDWGLYLAVEGVEDAFLLRNYGKSHGELYKPDSMDMGGGRGNGKGFDMEAFEDMFAAEPTSAEGGFPFANMRKAQSENAGRAQDDRTAFNDRPGGFGGMGSSDVKLVYTDDEFESYSNIFENAKTDVTDADKARLIDAIKRMNTGDATAVDVENVIRYFVVHNFVVNDDSYTGTMIHNYYLYEKNGALSMIPWDYNLAYGTFQGGNAVSSVNRDILSPVTGGMDDRPMIKWIFESEAFTDQYKAYFEEFLKTVNADQIIEDARAIIAPYVEKDPTKFCTYEEFETGVSALKTFVKLRTQSVSNQLAGNNEVISTTGFNTSDMGTMGRNRNNNLSMSQMPAGEPGMIPGDRGGMQMPFGGMGQVPNNGTQTPSAPPAGVTGWPFNAASPALEPSEEADNRQNESENATAPESQAQADEAQSAIETNQTGKNRFNQTQRIGNPFGGMAVSNMPDGNAQNAPSERMLLLISVIVLLASIGIAFFIKH